MPKRRTLPIVEHFVSVQGEGSLTGTNMLFVRIAGCNLACTFCDEPKHKDMSLAEPMEYRAIVKLAEKSKVKWVCITGGEPSLHNLNDLIQDLQFAGFKVQIETNGWKYENVHAANHVCISPKEYPIREGSWDSVKLLVDESYNKNTLSAACDAAKQMNPKVALYFQPINFDHEINQTNIGICLELQKDFPYVGLSVQLHKILGVE